MSFITALFEKSPFTVARAILYVFDVVNKIFGGFAFTTKGPVIVVIPETFNDDKHVVLFDNVATPETFNDDKDVVGLSKTTLLELSTNEQHSLDI